MSRITIKQVAQVAGVSPTAVSLAINGKPGISEQTRKRIMDVVQRMDFTPNENSRRLLSKKTGNIAVLLDQESSLLDQFFYSELNTRLIRECEDYHYNVVYSVARKDANQRIILPQVIRTRDVDGIIVIGYIDHLVIQRIQAYEYPIIIVDNYLPSSNASCVIFDYQAAAMLATEHLVKMGHQNIAYIGTDLCSGKIQFFGQQTFKGYKEALGKYNLSIPANWVQISATDEETAGVAMDRILESAALPTAVLCSGDIYAIGAMRSIKRHGMSIPHDMSIIGIDDILLSRYIEPALTTIRVDLQKMAAMAISAMCRKIESKAVQDHLFCKSLHLIERDSVKAMHASLQS